jgi:hypothetical protein
LWPWLALRVRLPILAAGAAAAGGLGYTLLTGSEVPTVRSCIGALLVLLALALGREPLSLRLLAVAAICVMLLWPEAVVGPSFQMSFGAVIAIVDTSHEKVVDEVRTETPDLREVICVGSTLPGTLDYQQLVDAATPVFDAMKPILIHLSFL